MEKARIIRCCHPADWCEHVASFQGMRLRGARMLSNCEHHADSKTPEATAHLIRAVAWLTVSMTR